MTGFTKVWTSLFLKVFATTRSFLLQSYVKEWCIGLTYSWVVTLKHDLELYDPIITIYQSKFAQLDGFIESGILFHSNLHLFYSLTLTLEKHERKYEDD